MNVKLFGIATDIVGQDELKLPESVNPKNVRELKDWLAEKYPGFQTLKSLAIAVNQEYADDDTVLQEDVEIALIPPVSGG